MNVERYLARIAYHDRPAPTRETLFALHAQHGLKVPFENFDIHMGRRIVLDVERIYAKVVDEHRGGFCYEQNGLFAAVLRRLGFDVQMLSARLIRTERQAPEFDHLTLRVVAEGIPYLVDVGFGDGMREPLELRAGVSVPACGFDYKICQRDGQWSYEMHDGNGFRRGYYFSLQRRTFGQFAGMCHYHQTDPRSWFVRERICTMATPTGRRSLIDDKFTLRINDQLSTASVVSDVEYLTILRESFGVDLPAVPRNKSTRLVSRAHAQALKWRHRATRVAKLARGALAGSRPITEPV